VNDLVSFVERAGSYGGCAEYGACRARGAMRREQILASIQVPLPRSRINASGLMLDTVFSRAQHLRRAAREAWTTLSSANFAKRRAARRNSLHADNGNISRTRLAHGDMSFATRATIARVIHARDLQAIRS